MTSHPGWWSHLAGFGGWCAVLLATSGAVAQEPASAPASRRGGALDASAPASAPASSAAPAARAPVVPEAARTRRPPRAEARSSAYADPLVRPHGLAIGLWGLGYFPVGSWIDHPYAGTIAPASLDYFGPGGGGAVEIMYRYGVGSFFLRGEAGTLSSTAWEDWTAQHGGRVTVRSLVWGISGGLGGVFAHLGRTRLEGDLLVGVLVLSAKETDPRYGTTYPLTFLGPAGSLRARVAAAVSVARGLELYLAFEAGLLVADLAAVPGKGPPTMLSLALGLRLWPLLMRSAR